jgi:hypothetical protein
VPVSNPDKQAPTVVSGLRVIDVRPDAIDFAWTASTDNVGVTMYRIYRNGVLVASQGPSTNYSSRGLAKAATYSFTVTACDAAGNCSIASAPLSATTGMMSLAFPGKFSDHNIARTSTGYVVRSNTVGTIAIPTNVKRLEFADKLVGLDIDGNAGQVYRLYQAAFGRKPDPEGLGFHIDAIESDGVTLSRVAQNFINSPEFLSRYGALNSTQFVKQLYHNVLHRDPDPAGLSYHVGNLDRGALTRAQVLIGFSESPENQAQVLGDIQNGIPYMPPPADDAAPDPRMFVSPFGR